MTALQAVVIVMMTMFAVSSCRTSPIVTDYTMSSMLSKTSSSNVYPNSAVPLKLEVKSGVPGEVTVEYVSSSLSGTLLVDEKTVLIGQSLQHDFSTPLYMSFVPNTSGKVSFHFRIRNERATNDAMLEFTVNEAAYQLAMLSDTIVTVGVKADLAFAIHEVVTKAGLGTKSGGDKYKVTAEITKGRGILQVKDKVLVDDSQTKLLDGVISNLTKASDGVEVTKDQETPFYYTSLAEGENNISFNVSDEYGNTVITPVKLAACNPEMNIRFSLNQDSTYKAATVHPFTIFPDAQGVDRKLLLAWSIGSKSEVKDISISNNEGNIVSSSQVSITANSANPFSLTANTTGHLEILFELQDEFGSRYDSIVKLEIESPTIDFAFPETFPDQSEWKPGEWVGELPTTSTLTYWIKYENADREAGILTINGKEPIYGEKTELAKGKNVFKYIPKRTGEHNLTFTVSDNFGNEKVYPVKFTVKANPLNIQVGTVNSVNYGQSVNVNVTIPSQEHISSFMGVVSSLNGGSATIEANGTKVTENKEFSLKTGSNVFKITPTKLADEYAFKLLVRTDIGQEEEKEIIVPIILPEMNAQVKTITGSCDLTGSLLYELTISEPHYTGSFTVSPTSVTGEGTLAISGKNVTNNQSTTIDKASTVPVTFKPTSASSQDLEITLRITDENGQEKVVTLIGQIDYPPLTATTSANGATIKYKTATPFTLTIKEELHDDDFSVVPTFVSGSGTLTIDDEPVVPGVKIELAGGTHNCMFTPDDCGAIDIKFEINDVNNQGTEAHALFTVEPYPLTFTMDNVSASEVNITVPVTFTLKIDEQMAPESPYKLTYTVFDSGTSKSLAKGAHNLSYTPTATGSHEVIFTLEDMFGQQAQAILNIEAKNAPLEASASAGELTTNVKKATAFTLSVNEADYKDQFAVTVTNTGSGTLTASGSPVTFGKSFNVAKGNTTMSYTPNTVGEHTLGFTVKDIYGQTKQFNVVVTSNYAPMTATASAPASILVGRDATINLSLAEENYSSNFTVSYTGGNGVLKKGGTTWSSGTEYSVASGSTNLTFTPSATGSQTLTFTVKDSYGQSKQTTATFTVNHANMTATASAPSSAYVGRAVTVALSLAEDSYSSTFKVSYTGGTGTLKQGSNTWSAGTEYTVSPGTTNLTFTPSGVGSQTLTFKIKDNYGQTKNAAATINISQAPLTVSATPAIATVYTKAAATSTLAISEAEHSGQFTVGATISGSGTLTINGSTVSSGGSIKVNGGNSSIGYTPSTAGKHTITLNVSDAYGQSKSTTFTVTANEPEIEASATSFSAYKGQSKEIVLNIDKPNYTGTFTTTVSKSGSGTLTLSSGGAVTGSLTLGKGATRFNYTPSATGTHTISFTIKASDGKTKTVTSTITVTESPLNLTVDPANATVTAGTSESDNYKDLQVYIGRSYYQGGLKLTLEKITTSQSYEASNSTRILIRAMQVNGELQNEYIAENSGTSTSTSVNRSWTTTENTTDSRAITVNLRCFGLYMSGAPSNTSKRFTLHFKATDDNGQSKTITANVDINL